MTGLSEDYFCAGWLIDCEYALWADLTGREVGGVRAWKITEDEVEELRLAHEVAGGWIAWPEEQRGPVFLSTAEWIDHIAARQSTSE